MRHDIRYEDRVVMFKFTLAALSVIPMLLIVAYIHSLRPKKRNQ